MTLRILTTHSVISYPHEYFLFSFGVVYGVILVFYWMSSSEYNSGTLRTCLVNARSGSIGYWYGRYCPRYQDSALNLCNVAHFSTFQIYLEGP